MLGRTLSAFCRCSKLPMRVTSTRNVYMYSPEPFHPIPDREPRITTAEEAVSVITTGNHVIDLGTARSVIAVHSNYRVARQANSFYCAKMRPAVVYTKMRLVK